MSIHAIYPCHGCKGSFAFPEYHWPHCTGNPKSSAAKKSSVLTPAKALDVLRAQGIGTLPTGPMRDQPVRKRRSPKKAPAKK